MTEAEMKAVAALSRKIEALKEELERARRVLTQVNLYGKAKSVWKPALILKAKSGSYSNDGVEIAVPIPFGIIQQSAVYEVAKIERAITMLGGTP